ncbi:MAG: hypothetical protein WBA73_01165 [Devosia sp.]
MAEKYDPKRNKAAPPEPVPPMPAGLPTSDAERPHTSPMRHGEKEPIDPNLPPEPGNDSNP